MKIIIIEDENGVLRWKENKDVQHFLKNISLNDFLKLGDDYGYFISKSQEIESAYMFESKIKNYLNNILKVQYFFEAKNLKYNFLFMQSALSEWHNIGDGVIKHELSMAHSAYQYMHTISDELIINPNYKKNNKYYQIQAYFRNSIATNFLLHTIYNCIQCKTWPHYLFSQFFIGLKISIKVNRYALSG